MSSPSQKTMNMFNKKYTKVVVQTKILIMQFKGRNTQEMCWNILATIIADCDHRKLVVMRDVLKSRLSRPVGGRTVLRVAPSRHPGGSFKILLTASTKVHMAPVRSRTTKKKSRFSFFLAKKDQIKAQKN